MFGYERYWFPEYSWNLWKENHVIGYPFNFVIWIFIDSEDIFTVQIIYETFRNMMIIKSKNKRIAYVLLYTCFLFKWK